MQTRLTLSILLLSACGGLPDNPCGELIRSGGRCVCPPDTVLVDDWTCEREDGSRIVAPGAPDASVTDSSGPPDSSPDSSEVADGGPVVDATLAPPLPIAPLSTSTVTSQRPTLRWALATDATGAEVELCRDRTMSTGCLTAFTAEGDRVRPDNALTPGVWFWRLRARAAGRIGSETSPTWQFWVGHRSADGDVDTSWGTTLDVNGDGFADLVVGAPQARGAGTASRFLGSATGLSATPVLVLEGVAAGDSFGYSAASAGDVNGDGFGDLIVGAAHANGRAGSVSLFLGSAVGLAPAPALVLHGVAEGDTFGYSVAGAGDVDGDGFADVAVGAPHANVRGRARAGTTSLYMGSAMGLSRTPTRVLEGGAAGDEFGFAVASAGDIDGDGFGDVVSAAWQASPDGHPHAGAVSLFLGSVGGLLRTPALVLTGDSEDDWFGTSVGAGDVNGDGFADLVIGAVQPGPIGRRAAGTAHLFLGSRAGLTPTASQVLGGAVADGEFGRAVSISGDVNGDGFADLVVGAWRASSPAGPADVFPGTASLFLGATTGLSASPARVLVGEMTATEFGWSVSSAGDVDHDGFVDVAIGTGFGSPGYVRFFRGSAAGLSTVPTRVLQGDGVGDEFGFSLAP